jgi:hypothetical protein
MKAFILIKIMENAFPRNELRPKIVDHKFNEGLMGNIYEYNNNI